MQILSRKDALEANIGQYFTGKPCKRGHLTYRYTQSGTCAACVAESAATARGSKVVGLPVAREHKQAEQAERIAEVMAVKQARDAAINSLVEVRFRIFLADLAMMRDTVAAMGLARYPMLSAAEFAAQGAPSSFVSGTALYRFRVAAEDIDMLREVANTLFDAHRVDVSGVHDRVARQAEKMADEAASPTPDGWK